MTQQEVLDYLLENGPSQISDFGFDKKPAAVLGKQLFRLYKDKELSRRKVDNKFVYRIRDKETFYLNDEPGYAYYLRNLPREVHHESR
jgi:hypothetical protein